MTKYDASMEKLVDVIEQFCTFPALEKMKLFRLVLFNFLVGNEDAQLKNFTLITRNNKIELSPAYDLLNSTIVLLRKEIQQVLGELNSAIPEWFHLINKLMTQPNCKKLTPSAPIFPN